MSTQPLSPLAFNHAFADLMGRLHEQLGGSGDDRLQVQSAAHALMQAQQQGHACLPLSEVAELNPQALRASPVFKGPSAPLVLTADGNLYLRRYFQAEQQLEQQLRALDCPAPLADEARLKAVLDKVFTEPSSAPRHAVFTALTRRLCVLCGGPGTGKTYTVARLVQALRLLQPELRIALAAPTGKAATRLQSALAALGPTHELSVSTVHRLLGLGNRTLNNTQHHALSYEADSLLPADVVIVDEASMLGLELAQKLLAALLPNARVVLVGDPHQLAAVETGSVLTPLANTPSPALVRLDHAWRFQADSNVPVLAQAVLNGEWAPLLAHAQATANRTGAADSTSAARHATAAASWPSAAQLFAGYEGWWQAVQQGATLEELLTRFDDYRVLTALRNGPRGAQGINAALTAYCRASLLADVPRHLSSGLLRSHSAASNGGEWFAGRPVLITHNDSATQLVNGDIGLAWPDPSSGWRVYFKHPTHGVRSVAHTDLPPHESAFALTVHKAQGSEYREVALVLPDAPSRVLTRELLYTGITRAKNRVHLFASAAVLQAAVSTSSVRWSGLKPGNGA